MDQARHALIQKAFGLRCREVLHELWKASVAYGASVDDLFQAGLGRGSTPEAARAAHAIKERLPRFFDAFQGAWPFVCPSCRADTTALVPCKAQCGASTCEGCSTRYGCPKCTAATQARIERGRQQNAENEATAKWISRQLAEASPGTHSAADAAVAETDEDAVK